MFRKKNKNTVELRIEAAKSVETKTILQCLKDLKDKEFQKRAGFGLGPEMSSPTEDALVLFDDYEFLSGAYIHKDKLEEDFYSLVEKLHNDIFLSSILDKHYLEVYLSDEGRRISLLAELLIDIIEKESITA